MIMQVIATKSVINLVGTINDQYRNFQCWSIKDDAEVVCKCSRWKAENSLFKLP